MIQLVQRPPEPLADIQVAQFIGTVAAVQDIAPDGGY